jgi:hypothetical protein
MRESYKSVDINGRKFRIKKFSAKDGSYIVLKVSALLAPMFEGVKWDKLAGAKKTEDVDASQINIAQMFGKLTELKESDFVYLQDKCLRVCEEELKAGYTPVLAENGTFAVNGLDEDVITVMALTVHALVFNLSGFFTGTGLGGLLSGLLTTSPQD